MPNTLWITYLGHEALFLAGGVLLLVFSLVSKTQMDATPSVDNVAQTVLLGMCSLTAAMVNAIFIFLIFLLGLPAVVMPSNTVWLRVHAWGVVVCALFTLILGLSIWFSTLKTRANLEAVWITSTPTVQSLLQQRFDCCGYTNSTSPPFIQDTACPNSLAAAQKNGCVIDFSNFANGYLNVVFTAAFGIIGIDALLIICIACLVKWRREQERYRHIDEKTGFGGL